MEHEEGSTVRDLGLWLLYSGNMKGAVQARSFEIRDSLRDSADRPQEHKKSPETSGAFSHFIYF